MNPDADMPMVLVNPEIIGKKGIHAASESCLSIPGISAPVDRAFEISVAFTDLSGRERQLEVKGLLARVIQHELDHLDGMLFVDRVSPVKKITLQGRLKRLKKTAETGRGGG